MSILYDLKYMTRPKTLKYAVEETNFIESLLEELPKLYYLDKIEFRTEHIMFDQSIFKEGLINVDIMVTKILKTYLKAVSPYDVQRNKRLMAHFIDMFDNLAE